MHFCEKLSANCTAVLEKSAKSATLSWKLQVGLFCTLTLCNAELGFQTAYLPIDNDEEKKRPHLSLSAVYHQGVC